ncbi:Gfo/Idh/MocA family protein [Novosphingobium mangrovi (ex Hu et al. 2023)]|uniref:Gfo/Idh/MocA family oxidoreductase n=1 Tax=Novosphingobium mangrovi (ex Hu et al. 2023) TaxID=2930094 RepID=A0ABT0AHK2_9SPHN|nr:Gfo/Idh/MocA family oxidoreductase [Novosphingobium mangrovi (ex Hu et al. 2023)]MCJ1962657.1 Gfo/Idh/MocA family oxidoreductase [Novosphingobium mangrovi (ex Hu et al. 2023)]
MDPIRIAIVGLGKIARDQHIPAIRGNGNFDIAATVSPHSPPMEGIPQFASIEELLDKGPAVDAVALCTPPQVRYDIAVTALKAGMHVFLEKPPGATLAEVEALKDRADKVGVTLFASWHSRFAAGVAPARAWLAERTVTSAKIVWREDVRVWHPGQDWIWQPGGLGVFDPGINALSIITHILPRPMFLKDATLSLPANRAAPIAADIDFQDTAGAPIHMDLDWRQTGPQSWDITVETDAGELKLSSGGAVLTLPSGTERNEDLEYAGLYARFANLIRGGRSDVDVAPMRLVADAFLRGKRQSVDEFHD